MRRIALVAAACIFAAPGASPAGAAQSATGAVVIRLPSGMRVAASAAIVQVTSTRTVDDRTELRGVSALSGLVRARRIVVPTRGFAGATVEGLVVGGRAIQVHPNTLVSLGSLDTSWLSRKLSLRAPAA